MSTQPTTDRSEDPSGTEALALANCSAEVSAALQWVEADPLDNNACDAAHQSMSRLPGLRDFWPLNSAPARVLDNAAANILAAEVRRLRALMPNKPDEERPAGRNS